MLRYYRFVNVSGNDNGHRYDPQVPDPARVDRRKARPPAASLRGATVSRYAIGVDFGTDSGRAVLVDVANGVQLATAVQPYRNGVIDERLPDARRQRGPVPRLGAPGSRRLPAGPANRGAGRRPGRRASIRRTSSASASTSPPAPCCRPRPMGRRSAAPGIPRNPHAWVKLWKHHAAQPEADRINEVARQTGQAVARSLRRQDLVRVVLLEGPPDPRRGARGLRRRGPAASRPPTGSSGSSPAARRATRARPATRPCGRSATASRHGILRGARPRLEHVVDAKMRRTSPPLGERPAGCPRRPPSGPVCGPAPPSPSRMSTPTWPSRPRPSPDPGRMVMIMGTSTCHMVLSRDERTSCPACAAASRTASSPASSATRPVSRASAITSSGSSRTACRRRYEPRRDDAGHRRPQPPGGEGRPHCSPVRRGLLALDWWNGNRSVLVDVELTGLLVGMTLRPSRRRSTAR